MPALFEYGDWVSIKNSHALKRLLVDIWQQKLFIEIETELNEEKIDKRYQPFIDFDDEQIRANNYVGFICNNDELIEIYPKVFKHCQNAHENKELMLQHIFYWFGYCRRWRFPFVKTSLETKEIKEFPELIIYIIACQFYEIVSQQPLLIYQEVEEALQTPRGKISFPEYIKNNISHGNFQNIDCIYEPFIFDNKVNRIIKYCSRLLLCLTKFYESQRILQEITFILDEVEDLPCTVKDIDGITLNAFFEVYSSLLDSCRLILNQQLYSNHIYDMSQWCLLFPMEYIFEDFLAGFIETEFSSQLMVEYQKSDKYLAINEFSKNVFNMKHDIFITSKKYPERKMILDAKYKLRDFSFKNDPKKGILQKDLYQMVSYAYRRGCTNLVLVYPNITEKLNVKDKFEIISGFQGEEKINVTAMEVPFWSLNNFSDIKKKLKDAFEDVFKLVLI
jgi:5-methylcytosine-specific restriction enzyme subunit McrC